MKASYLGLGTAIALLPAVAMADDSWFAALRGGLSYTEDVRTVGTASGLRGSTDLDNGYAIGIGVGHTFGDFAGELELIRRDNDVNEIGLANSAGLGTGNGLFAGDGSVKSTAVMANLYYMPEFDFAMKPYFGAGFGFAHLSYDKFAVGGVPVLDDTKTKAAYQLIAGLRMAISKAVDLTFDYRYFVADKPTLVDALSRPLKAEYDNHTFMIGLLWRFGGQEKQVAAAPEPAYVAPQPAPEPEPAPQPEPAQAPEPIGPFIVYFDWDSAEITREAAAILDEAAAAYKSATPVRVTLRGHTDTSGSNSYNERLSERRSTAVRNALISRGVPETAIRQSSFGEERPAVGTGDGVREPLNRRVEINFE
jgi:OOP family OmpA-OmpF porin